MEQETIQIEKLETNDYILTFDVNQFSENIDGHKWSLLIKSYSEKEVIDLEGIVHDPESDFYSATAASIEPLQRVVSIIKILTSNKNLKDMAAESIGSKYHDEDDMSTEEWLKMLEEEGVDMNIPRKTTFLFSTMQDDALAKKIEKELKKNDYKTEIDIFDGDFIIEAQINMKPKLSDIQEVEEEFRSMAFNYGAIYISCEI